MRMRKHVCIVNVLTSCRINSHSISVLAWISFVHAGRSVCFECNNSNIHNLPISTKTNIFWYSCTLYNHFVPFLHFSTRCLQEVAIEYAGVLFLPQPVHYQFTMDHFWSSPSCNCIHFSQCCDSLEYLPITLVQEWDHWIFVSVWSLRYSC